jgi:hypothetical protein
MNNSIVPDQDVNGKQIFHQSPYRDARWLKLRNAAWERDGYRCQRCGQTKDLSGHHHWYPKDGPIWNAPLEAITTLCWDCHQREHDRIGESRRDLIWSLRRAGWLSHELGGLAQAIRASKGIEPEIAVELIRLVVEDRHWTRVLFKYIEARFRLKTAA